MMCSLYQVKQSIHPIYTQTFYLKCLMRVFVTDLKHVVTMSSLPCFWKRLEMATVVSTVAAKAR